MGVRTRKPERTKPRYQDLVHAVARDRFLKGRNFTREDIRHVIDVLITVLYDALLEYEEVRIPGFGTFYRIFKNKVNVRNPQTKEIMTLPGRFEVRFSMGAKLKRVMGKETKDVKDHVNKTLESKRKAVEAVQAPPTNKPVRKQLETDL